MPSYPPHVSLSPLRHTTWKKTKKWPSANLAETFQNDNLLHHKSNGEHSTQSMCHMREISISDILCAINPKNREVFLWTLKVTIYKSGCRPIIVQSLSRRIQWCKNCRNLSLYAEDTARWKLWMNENFSSKCWIEKRKKDENPRWSIYIQIMDETPFTWMNPISSKILNDNPPFGWKLEKNS